MFANPRTRCANNNCIRLDCCFELTCRLVYSRWNKNQIMNILNSIEVNRFQVISERFVKIQLKMFKLQKKQKYFDV